MQMGQKDLSYSSDVATGPDKLTGYTLTAIDDK